MKIFCVRHYFHSLASCSRRIRIQIKLARLKQLIHFKLSFFNVIAVTLCTALLGFALI